MAKTIQLFGLLDAKKLLETGKEAAFVGGEPAGVGADTAASRIGRIRAKKKLAGAEVD